MRTLYLTIFFPPSVGGVQSYSYDLVKNLCQLGEEVTVIAPTGEGADRVDTSLPCYVVRIPAQAGWREWAMLWRTARLLRQQHFDRIFCSDWKPAGVVAWLITRFTRVPYFVAAHGSELLDDYNSRYPLKALIFKGLRIFRWRVFKDTEGVFAVSRYTADLVRRWGIPPDRIRIIPNGVETNRFFPEGKSPALMERYGLKGKKVILTVARLDDYKGHDVVIRALTRVLDQLPDVMYLIVGRGSERSRLESLARELGIAEHVIFAGHVPDNEMRAHYNLADVFIMLSRKAKDEVEGFGLTYLEANACGKPVIGGRSGGTEEAIVGGETGLLVNPQDVSGVADALTCILRDQELAIRLGSQGLQRVEKSHNWAAVAERIRGEMERKNGAAC